MGQIRISRPSPAILVAVLALIAAVAGTAVAGPVATKKAVTKKKVKKIADKEIEKLAPGLSVANADALGGKPASAYASPTSYRLEFNQEVIPSFANGATDDVTASCDPGEHVTGGGGNSNEQPNVVMAVSTPSGAAGWRAGFRNVSGSTLTNAEIRVFAICASP